MIKSHVKRSKEIVSFTMSRVRSKGSKIENIMTEALEYLGIRFKCHQRIVGTPDFVLIPFKIAIFCDSEFWHGYNWDVKRLEIKTNKKFWIEKIETNMARDRKVDKILRRRGWSVLRFWGDEIRKDITRCAEKIARKIDEKN